MVRHIVRQGSQLVMYVPKDIVEELGWIPSTRDKEGTPLMIEREGNRIIVRRHEPRVNLTGGMS